MTYLRERIKEVLTGASGSVVVRLYGPDTAVLRAKAKDVEAAMKDVPGVTNLKVEPRVLVAQINVQLRPEGLRKFGLTPGHVRRASTVLLKGQQVDEVFDGQKKFDVVVWGASNLRSGLGAVQELPIDVQNGTQVRLKDVADVFSRRTERGAAREHESAPGRDVQRVRVGSRVGRARGRGEGEADPARARVPPGVPGEYQARQESTRKLYALSALALAGIVLLLFVDFGAWRPTLLVALTIPFALVGGVFAVTITTGVVSLGSMVGFVTVLGIAARNGIMLVSHFRHLETKEVVPFGMGLVLRGAEERLAPILMTALATGLALLPLAITGNKPGQEIEYPLAVVILGGLVTSTLLNLSLLPPLYFLVGRPVSTIDCQ